MENEKFYVHVDFLEEELDVDVHATQVQIAIGIIGLAENLKPEMLEGLIESLKALHSDVVSGNVSKPIVEKLPFDNSN